MRITDTQYGTDTGMWLVDVVLDTPEEAAMTEAAIWQALTPQFEERGIDPAGVVDIFVYTTNAQGDLTPWPR